MSDFRDTWVRAALGIGLAAPALFLFAAFGTKFALFDWRTGFSLLTMVVLPSLSAAGLLTGLVGLVLARRVEPRRGWRLALTACVISGVALAGVAGVLAKAQRTAPIHDVSTDLDDPPDFPPQVAAERALVKGGNDLDLENARVPGVRFAGEAAGKRVVAVQQAAYPDIAPIPVGAAAPRAFAAARGVARNLGWTIDRVDPKGFEFQGRAEDFWFGFTADVAVRVTPADPGAVVDVRSSSRMGVGDLGSNAARVRAFARELAKALDQEKAPAS